MTDSASEARVTAPDQPADKRVGGVFAPAGFSWALFEFARNPYYMLIVTYVFPPYFAQYVIGDPVLGQAAVSEATKWAGVIGAFTAPVLGAMMDRGGPRKPLMALFLAMLAVSGMSLWFSLPGGEGIGVTGTMAFLVLGYVGYTYSEMMHNAMLNSAGRPKSLSNISGAGIGLGQLSSALGLAALAVLATASPVLGTAETGFLLQRGTGPAVIIWLMIFVIPFFLFMPDGAPPGGTWSGAAQHLFSRNGKFNPIGQIAGLGAYIVGLFRTFPETMKYLVARLIYADGMISLLALGGVYSTGVLGWTFTEGVLYGIWASLFGMTGGLFLAGRLDRLLGVRRAIILQLVLLCVTVVIALGITQDAILYGLVPSYDLNSGPMFNSLSDVSYLGLTAVIAALAAANISSSRYMMIVLAPKERLSEFFGLYALSSTATVWLGPLLTEFATRTSGDQRIGFSPVLLLLAVGLCMMLLVKKAANEVPGATARPPSAH